MTLVIILFVTLIAIGSPNRSAFHPATAALLTSQNVDSIDCEPTTGPDSVLDAPKPSRTSNFQLSGEYKCHRPIFAADERNPFVERVLKAQTNSARQVSLSVEKLLRGQKTLPITVRVEGPVDPELRAKVEALYRQELTQVAGASQTSHDRADKSENPLLEIQIHLVDDPSLMSSARLRLPPVEKEGAPIWQKI